MKFTTVFFSSQQHVSLATTAMATVPALSQNLLPNSSTLLFVYCLTSLTYILERLIPQKEDQHTKQSRQKWFLENRQYLFLYLFILILYIAYFSLYIATKASLVLCFLLGVLTLSYIVPFKKIKNAKQVIGGKDILVASVWTSFVLIFPVLQDQLSWDFNHSLLFMQCLIISLVNCFYFDLRDIREDKKHKIKSLAQQWGEEKTKKWIQIILLVNTFFCLLFPVLLNFVHLNLFYLFVTKQEKVKYHLLDLSLAWPGFCFLIAFIW